MNKKQPPKEEKLENLIKELEKEAEDDKFEEWWNGRGDEIFAFLEPQQILMVKAMASASWDASKAQILKDNPLAVLSEEDKSALEIGRDFLKFTKNFKEKFKYKQELSKREKETQP